MWQSILPGTKHPYLIEGQNAIYEIDALTGHSTLFATVRNPKKIVFGGREQRLHALLPNSVISLGLSGRTKARTNLEEPLAEIAYDTRNKRLVGVSQQIDKLYFFDLDLNPAGAISLPAFRWNAPVSMSINPKSGVIWLHCDGSPRSCVSCSSRVIRTPEITELMLQGARQPIGLTIDDQGHLFVSDGGRLAEIPPERPLHGALAIRRAARRPNHRHPSLVHQFRSTNNERCSLSQRPAQRRGVNWFRRWHWDQPVFWFVGATCNACRATPQAPFFWTAAARKIFA